MGSMFAELAMFGTDVTNTVNFIDLWRNAKQLS